MHRSFSTETVRRSRRLNWHSPVTHTFGLSSLSASSSFPWESTSARVARLEKIEMSLKTHWVTSCPNCSEKKSMVRAPWKCGCGASGAGGNVASRPKATVPIYTCSECARAFESAEPDYICQVCRGTSKAKSIEEAGQALTAALLAYEENPEPEPWCTCGAKTPQGKYHNHDCPAYIRTL